MIGNGHAGFGRGALEKGRKAPRQRPTSAVFADMMSRWERRYQGVPGAHGTIAALVREWFEQALVEVVLSARSFGRSPHWDSNDLAALLSPAALTAAVLPRQLVDAQIKKRLAQKLGR